MKRGSPPLLLLAGAAVALVPARAAAYTIASGFSESCHELLGLAATAELVTDLDVEGIQLPADDLWRRIAADLAPAILPEAGPAAGAMLTPAQQFVLFSLVVGIRSPDTAGHSVANLDDLRRAQIDPSPNSQHLHCLRTPEEDGLAGDVSVLNGSEALIREALADAAVAARDPARVMTEAPFYLDFYGALSVEVHTASYLVGRAMHTLQDCHSHTLRSADARTVFTVLNYVDAVAGTLNEARDGMAHSDTLDDCRRAELGPVVARASATSNALALAAVALIRDGDGAPLDAGFAGCPDGETDLARCGWIAYVPGCAPTAQPPAIGSCCGPDNAYCGSPYLDVAREKLTRPYVAEVLGCAVAAPPRGPDTWRWLALAALAGVTWRRRRGRRRPSRGAALAVLALATSSPVPARAGNPDERAATASRGPFIALEGHASSLSDIPGRSFLDVTVGYALRGGYRFGRWGLIGQIERNYWLPTELSNDLEPGALDIGVGAEWLVLDGRVRLSATAGPSILMFDTALDAKGTVGLFVDLRPAGLRWRPQRWLAIVLDPLSLAIVAPVLGSPGIHQQEYRTVLGVEVFP